MFTGIIEGLGVLQSIRNHGEGKRLTIETDMDLAMSRIGDSIAVNGACLTAVTLSKRIFSVDMAPETVSKTTFKHLKAGARVNLERALRLSDRLDGHLVSGHIDGTGVIRSKENRSNAVIVTIEVSPFLASEMITKGSVAVDGISLTINRCSENDFEVSVIPHTAAITTIGFKGTGDEVNIETDMLGKYVRKFMMHSNETVQTPKHSSSEITMGFLARNGFV